MQVQISQVQELLVVDRGLRLVLLRKSFCMGYGTWHADASQKGAFVVVSDKCAAGSSQGLAPPLPERSAAWRRSMRIAAEMPAARAVLRCL